MWLGSQSIGSDGSRRCQLDGYVPLRQVAVDVLAVGAESAVDGSEAAQTGIVEAFERADPQFEIGVDGVLDEHRYVGSALAQGVGYLLHGERVGRCAGAYPEHVDTGVEGVVDMLAHGHFGGHGHAGLLLYAPQPLQPGFAHAFEAAGLGAGFPYSGTEYAYAVLGERSGRVEGLFLGFCAAGAGYYYRFVVARVTVGEGQQVGHRCHRLR